ncbi:MAG: hypothetical protein EOP50_02770 [Sphingobacteriales bacterium]|nr:MAG: hypothetical protein EOP50_02770 [Sphingobacteriales bacterium]
MQTFSLGGSEHDRVEVHVHSYERAPVGDYHDDNWVRVSVRVCAGAFSGEFDGTFLTPEFSEFRDSLRVLHRSLTGKATFSTLEGQLTLELAGDGRGHISLRGVALDAPGMGNKLEFRFDLDQGHLSPALADLDEIVAAFPVRIS